MLLTTKARYAIMAMCDIAANTEHISQTTKISDISERQSISVSYLEQIFLTLKKSNLVKSLKGPGGGYLLNKIPDEIRLSEIIDCVNERIEMVECKNMDGSCRGQSGKCITHNLWSRLDKKIYNLFHEITLKDVIEGKF